MEDYIDISINNSVSNVNDLYRDAEREKVFLGMVETGYLIYLDKKTDDDSKDSLRLFIGPEHFLEPVNILYSGISELNVSDNSKAKYRYVGFVKNGEKMVLWTPKESSDLSGNILWGYDHRISKYTQSMDVSQIPVEVIYSNSLSELKTDKFNEFIPGYAEEMV